VAPAEDAAVLEHARRWWRAWPDRACRRGQGSLAGHGQPLFREHGLLGGRGSLVAAQLAVI